MYTRILAALDGSESARLALREALKLALTVDATVMVARVVRQDQPVHDLAPGIVEEGALALARRELRHARALCARSKVRAVTQIIDAHGASTPSAIMQAAQVFKADLIVMGTHGRRGVRRHLLGSVAETVLRSSSVQVLLVRDSSNDEALAA
jgi:nucleotide-binding universal stress UspA family protein